MNEVIAVAGRALGRAVKVARKSTMSGDVRRTGGDIAATQRVLCWSPRTRIEDWISRQVAWQREGLASHRAHASDGS